MKKFLLSISLFIFAFTAAFGQIADPSAPLQNDPNYRYGKLENGLTYYIRHNDKPAQRAEFYLITNVGAIQETPAQDGLAHFLEHMALNGTQNLPGKMMLDYFQTIGVEFGRNINASTGVEQTMYMLNNIPVTRQGIIDTALLIMHDYSAFVTNDPKEVEKERGVIIEEWRTRRNAEWRMMEKEFTYIFKGSKYAGCTIIGDKKNLETFHPEEIVKFYKTWYRPDLQAVIVTGDIDVDAIEAQIKTLFADIPARVNPEPKVMHQIPDNEEPIVAVITDPEASSTVISAYFKSDPLPMEYRSLGVSYLTDMVSGLISSMISERVSDISKQPNAPFLNAFVDVSSQICMTKDAFTAQVSCKEGEGISAFTALMTELHKVKKFGFTEAEYDRAKTNMLRGLERAKDNASSRKNGELVYPCIYNFFMGKPYLEPEYEYNVAKGYTSVIPLAQINQMVAQFDFSKNAVIVYKANEKEGLTHPTEAQLVEAMVAASNAEIQAPVEESINEPLVNESALKGSAVKKTTQGAFGTTVWTLKNGIKVIVKPTDYKKEEVLISMSNEGGLSNVLTEDLPSLDGNVFYFYNSNSGVSKFPETKLSKMLTGKSLSINPYISELEQGVSGSSSPKDLETFFQLLYLYYTEPRFVEEEFAPGMDQLKAVVPNVVKQPDFQFQTNLMKILYGDNPRKALISPEMLEKVKLTTLEKVYKGLFSNAAGSVVTIVGNVDLATLKPMVEKYVGSIPVGKKAPKWIDQKNYIAKGKIEHPFEVEMTTPKTRVGLVVDADMPYTLENIVISNAVNYILDLIYTETIREEEGGTYGVSSRGSLSPLPKNEYVLLIAFDTEDEKAPKLIQLAKDGLFGIAKNGVTADQLNKAKENSLKNLPENRINNNYWNGCISMLEKYGIDKDTEYANVVNGITAEKIQNFVKKALDQGNFIEAVMTPKK